MFHEVKQSLMRAVQHSRQDTICDALHFVALANLALFFFTCTSSTCRTYSADETRSFELQVSISDDEPETNYHQLYHLKSLVRWRRTSDIKSDYAEQLTFFISNMFVLIKRTLTFGEFCLGCRSPASTKRYMIKKSECGKGLYILYITAKPDNCMVKFD